jgi:hypothetical protein
MRQLTLSVHYWPPLYMRNWAELFACVCILIASEKSLWEEKVKTREELAKKREESARRAELEHEQRVRDDVNRWVHASTDSRLQSYVMQ